jgi:hypothetical protein
MFPSLLWQDYLKVRGRARIGEGVGGCWRLEGDEDELR